MTALDAGLLSLFPEMQRDVKSFTTGILPSQRIEELVRAGRIAASVPIAPEQIQPASLDLRLGEVAYRVRASFLPGRSSTVLSKTEELKSHEIDLTRPTVLERGCVYIVPLLEEWRLPASIAGRVNPKSTTGRLDIFTRLITDYGTEFERVPNGYRGPLYVEIVPRTFSIVVQTGISLNQVRFIRGAPLPSDTAIEDLHEQEALLYLEDVAVEDPSIRHGLWISVDLEGGEESDIIGYRAKAHAPPIDLSKVDYYDPLEFWDPIIRPKNGRLILNPEEFYILASKERLRVPPEVAAELVGYDPSVGEFRIHYAGFFDPGFGYGTSDMLGTHAVLEVRSHEVPFALEDGQRVGAFKFERLLTAPDKMYGAAIGSSYDRQRLSLSKQFRRLTGADR